MIPIVGGENLADWWNASSRKVTSADCVWSVQQGGHSVGIFAFCWETPRKEKDSVEWIQLTAEGYAVIGLLAIVGEEQQRRKE